MQVKTAIVNMEILILAFIIEQQILEFSTMRLCNQPIKAHSAVWLYNWMQNQLRYLVLNEYWLVLFIHSFIADIYIAPLLYSTSTVYFGPVTTKDAVSYQRLMHPKAKGL